MSVKTPRVGPGDNWGLVDQTGVFVLHRQRTLPLQPGSRPVRSSEMGSAHYSSKQTRRRPAERTPRQIDAAKVGTDAEPPGGAT